MGQWPCRLRPPQHLMNMEDVCQSPRVPRRGLELAPLSALLQRVRRRPYDGMLRIRLSNQIDVLADYAVEPDEGADRLLADAIVGARLLRRALHRANKTELPSSEDTASVAAWIDNLQAMLLKTIERPGQP